MSSTAPVQPLLLSSGLRAVVSCVLQKCQECVQPTAVAGVSAPEAAEEPGPAGRDLLRPPLASEPALQDQFLTLFLMLIRALVLWQS